jgi:outer membrane lipoprotein SlyB
MTLSFNQLTVNGRNHAIKGMATNAFESGGIRDEGVKAGAGGAVGGIIGGIIGGVKGALIGAAVGAGGVIAATEGKDVDLKPGTIIRMRLDSAVNVSAPRAICAESDRRSSVCPTTRSDSPSGR